MQIFDTHAHYDDRAFDEDRNAILEGGLFEKQYLGFETADENEVEKEYIVTNVANIGCSIKSSVVSADMAKKYDYMYAVVGVIPHHVADMTEDDIETLRTLARENEKVVAIGEIGLDYYYEEPSHELQHRWFVRQMELAKELGLPIVIHSRDAAQDTVELMKQAHAEEIGGVVHCYSYSEEMSREFLKMGFFFGIGGVVTFKNSKKLKRAVESIPLDRIVLETDSPYLTPSPNRGKRNDSRYLPYVIHEIARLKGLTPEEVAETTYQNALRLYNLKPVREEL
ncbi:TatD DNase family protein [Lachnospiraceae bacterium NE2001]|nr:TatD DNase family protein [Lachnospiraceae bacterium NE2001]